MKKEEIRLADLQRILLGEAPPHFLAEVLLRSLIVYLGTLLVMRWLGKRMNGQLTVTELAVLVMMGAIIALPMQAPDRGIFQGVVILLTVLGLLRTINYVAFRSSRFEHVLQGEVLLLVRDGRLELDTMRRANISQQQLYAHLRSHSIFQLGRVKRLYLETSGKFSLYPVPDKDAAGIPLRQPGLPILPPNDNEALARREKADALACCTCGNLRPAGDPGDRCDNCGGRDWTPAIY